MFCLHAYCVSQRRRKFDCFTWFRLTINYSYFRYVLNVWYSMDDVCRISSSLKPEVFGLHHALASWSNMPRAPLSTAARVSNIDFESSNTVVEDEKTSCDCKGICDSRRCHCKKRGEHCNDLCHEREKIKYWTNQPLSKFISDFSVYHKTVWISHFSSGGPQPKKKKRHDWNLHIEWTDIK